MLGTYGQYGDMGEGGEVESTPHFQFLGCKAVRVMMPGVLQGGEFGALFDWLAACLERGSVEEYEFRVSCY